MSFPPRWLTGLFGRRRRAAADPVEEARIQDLLCGDLDPAGIDAQEPAQVRASARWVSRLSDETRALGPDPGLARRIQRGLPVGVAGGRGIETRIRAWGRVAVAKNRIAKIKKTCTMQVIVQTWRRGELPRQCVSRLLSVRPRGRGDH